MLRSSVVVLATLAAIGCGGHSNNEPACALDIDATYTVYTHTLTAGEAPEQHTLVALLGECAAPNGWIGSCAGEVVTYRCDTDTATFRVTDADNDGYTVQLEHGGQSSTIRLVETVWQ